MSKIPIALGVITLLFVAAMYAMGFFGREVPSVRDNIEASVSQVKDTSNITSDQETTLRLQLAIGDFMIAQARPPKNLSELVPAYYDKVPVNPVTGDAFEYQLVNGQPLLGGQIQVAKDKKKKTDENLLGKGFNEIKKVFSELKNMPEVRKYLLAFFFYSAGVQTIIYVATVFAEKVLGFESGEMIAIVLVLQLVGVGGAYLFAQVSDMIGNKKSLVIMVLIWILICFIAYFCQTKLLFYITAGLVGLVMGGIQSISRSTYSKMLDGKEEVTSYFSFYDVTYKSSIVLGTLAYGVVDVVTGNLRYSVLALGLFFVAGLFVLMKTDFVKAMKPKISS